jgi:hypothetical protein
MANVYVAPSHPQRAREVVFDYIKKRLEPSDNHVIFSLDDVYVVSFFYVLGNWKALVSTTLPDGMYYEVTRNESQHAIYITAYKQWEHVTVLDEDL